MKKNMKDRIACFVRSLTENFERASEYVSDAISIANDLMLHSCREEFNSAWEWRKAIVGDKKNGIEGFAHVMETIKEQVYGNLSPESWRMLRDTTADLRSFPGGFDPRTGKTNITYLYSLIGREKESYQDQENEKKRAGFIYAQNEEMARRKESLMRNGCLMASIEEVATN